MGTRPPGRRTLRGLWVVWSLVLVSADAPDHEAPPPAIAVVEPTSSRPIEFATDILPIFRSSCLACHNAKDAKGDLVLETPAAILKGGETGPAVVPAKADESLLLKAAAHRGKPIMPPRKNKVHAEQLTPEQLGLLKRWIDQGAKGQGAAMPSPVDWQAVPAGFNAIYALAVSGDGQYAACGRGNQIDIYHLPSRRWVGQLSDPSLAAPAGPTTAPATAPAHRDVVQSLAFTPDGKLLASGGYREVKLWQRPLPSVMLNLTDEHVKSISAVAASPDGKLLAAAGDDHVIRLYDHPSGKLRASLEGHTATVNVLRFSADAQRLYSGADDQEIRAWDIAGGKTIARIGTPAAVTALAVLGSGELVSGGADNLLRMWSVPQPPQRILDADAAVTAVAMTVDRKRAAVADDDHKIRLIEIDSGKLIGTLDMAGAAVRSLSFNRDGSRLLAAAEGHLTIWDTADRKAVATLDAPPSMTAAALRPDGKQLVIASGDGTIVLWRAQVPEPREILKSDDTAAGPASVSADGRCVATCRSDDGKPVIQVRQTDTGKLVQTLAADGATPACVTLSADGSRIAVAGDDHIARVFDIANAKELCRFVGHTQNITAIAFSPNGQQVASAAADGVLKIWAASDGKEIRGVTGLNGQIAAIAFSADGNQIGVAAADQKVRVITVADGSIARALTVAEPAKSLAFDSESKRLICGGTDRIGEYDAADGTLLETIPAAKARVALFAKPDELLVFDGGIRAIPTRFVRLLKGPSKRVTHLLYRNDGLLYAAGDDGTVRGFSSEDGAQRFSANAGGAVTDLALSPDDHWLASTAQDKFVRLWNADNGAPGPKPQFGPLSSPIRSVGFTADGKRLIAGGAEAITLFDMEQGAVIETDAAPAGAITYAGGCAAAGPRGAILLASDKGLFSMHPSAIRQMSGHGAPVTSIAAIPNAPTQFIAGSREGSVRQWDGSDGRQLRETSLGGPVACVAVRADGKRYAAAGPERFAKLWNVDDNREIATVRGDRYASEFVELQQRKAEYADAEIQHWKNEAGQATERQNQETQSVARATQAKADEEKRMAERKKTLDERMTAKSQADKALADATAALTKATADKEASAKDAVTAAAAPKQYQATLEEARKAAQAAASQANAKMDQARQAKAAADAAMSGADKSPAATAKAAQAKDAADAARKAADEAAEQSKTAAQAVAAAEKMLADLNAQAQKSAQAKETAEQQFNQATNRHRDAENQAKEMDRQAAGAELEYTDAKFNVASAMKAVISAQAGVAKAAEDIEMAKQAQTEAEALLIKTKADVESARKAANDAEKPLAAVAFSQDGSTLFTAAVDGAIHAWGSETGGPLETLRGSAAAVTSLAVAADGSLICGSADGSVKVWDMSERWNLRRTIGDGSPASPLVGRVLALAFSPDGATLATGSGIPSRSGEVKLWSAADGTLVREIPDAHSDTVFGLSFSSDGKMLASCAADKFVKVFSTSDGKLVRSFEGHTDHVLSVSFRYDNRALVSGGADRLVKFWDVTTGEQKAALEPFESEVTSVAYVGFTDTALATTGDGAVRLVRQEGVARNYDAAPGFLNAAAVTPDGQLILAGGQESILRIWNGRDGPLIAAFNPPAKSSEKSKIR